MIDLYERTPLETQVVVRSYDESVLYEGEEMANRGVELPPVMLDPDRVYAAVEREKQRREQAAILASQEE